MISTDLFTNAVDRRRNSGCVDELDDANIDHSGAKETAEKRCMTRPRSDQITLDELVHGSVQPSKSITIIARALSIVLPRGEAVHYRVALDRI